MLNLHEFPLLRQLSPVDLSKLVPNVTTIRLDVGERLSPDQLRDAVYFVQSGLLEVRSIIADDPLPLLRIRPGDLLGETALSPDQAPPLEATALHPSQVLGIAVEAFVQLLRTNASLHDEFTRIVLSRYAGNLNELARGRRLIQIRSLVVERLSEEASARQASARNTGGEIARAAARSEEAETNPLRSLVGLTLATALAAIILFSPQAQGLDASARKYLAVLMWGAVCWLFQALPDYAVGLATCLGIGLVDPNGMGVALSGFSSPTWFLLLGVWAIGVAAGKTGLLYRISLHILRIAPPTYLGRTLALAVTGVVLTPMLPSPQGRIAMAAPLTQELGEAMRFPRSSNGLAGLAMASFLGFGEMYFLFLNGTTTGILAWSLLPVDIQAQVTWLFWFKAALPLGIIVFVLTYWATCRLLPAEPMGNISSRLVSKQLRVLGPLRGEEKVAGAVITGVLLAFVTAPLHHVEPAVCAMGGMLILVALGILDRQSLGRDVQWNFLLFFGSVMGIANAARVIHLDTALSTFLEPIILPAIASPVTAVLTVGVLTLLLRLIFSPIQVVPLLTIILSPIFMQADYNPFGVVLAVLATSTTFAIPVLSPAYVSMQAGTENAMFTTRQIRPLAVWHSLILLVGLLACAPYWVLIQAL